MTEQSIKDFTTPKRVWINCHSNKHPQHEYHGKVGIAHTITNSLDYTFTTIYFTEGKVLNMVINPLYLEIIN